ncbi:MAG: vitamin B12-dependent ribonucleotide reductase, partial [Vulcanimicrobiaceae bacterium]
MKTIKTEVGPFLVPKRWSDRAASIAARLYARAYVPDRTVPIEENGIPSFFWRSEADTNAVLVREQSIHQIYHRIIGGVLYRALQAKRITHRDAEPLYRRLLNAALEQKWAPNSPQFFNGGLYWAYGLTGPNIGLYRVDENGSTVETSNSYEWPQLHACFLLDVDDSLCGADGIMELLSTEAKIFKSGSGAGVNFSPLRGAGEPLSGGGTSSGLMPFLGVSDASAGAIKSGGTTRRAAKMVMIDSDHPDVMTFIAHKAREEQKAGMLALGSRERSRDARLTAMTSGLPSDMHVDELTTDWKGEAFATVRGQNANFCVRWLGDLGPLLDNPDREVYTVERTTGKKTAVPFHTLWNNAAAGSWACGDPGWHFARTAAAWHTTPSQGDILTVNPCSEFLSHPWSGCNLASINVGKLYDTERNRFAIEDYSQLALDVSSFLSSTIDAAGYPHRKIAESSARFRQIGGGLANIGGLFLRMGIAYDSPTARAIASALYSILTARSLTSGPSVKEIREELPQDADARARVIRMHQAAAGIDNDENVGTLGHHLLYQALVPENILTELHAAWHAVSTTRPEDLSASSQVTVAAPTGTISLIMDCEATGMEPLLAPVITKSLVGGETLLIEQPLLNEVLIKLGYDEETARNQILSDLIAPEFPINSTLQARHRDIFASATGNIPIRPHGHLNMVAALQPHLSGGVSKTINLPSWVTP